MQKRPECRTPERKQRIHEVLAKRQQGLCLVLDNIHDPHNVSAIFRSCDAFGVPCVHLYYTDTPFPNLGKKSSGSAKKWVEQVRHTDAQKMTAQLQSQGYQIISTGFDEHARPVTRWDFTRPVAICLGNEHRGVTAPLRQYITDQLYIPMQGMVQSLNVSVAAAVILYEAFRQRSAKGMYSTPTLSSQTREQLAREWCRR